MGYTHFDKVSGTNGLAVGAKGSEKVISDALGRMYLNFEPGSHFFVDSVNGSAGNDGLTWATALISIDAAVNKCTANKGDIVWVAAGHNEGLILTEIDFDVAGITVIGLGTGSAKPTLDFDHANAIVAIGANNVTLANLRFRVSANAVVCGLDVEAGATGANIRGCDFGYAETATDEFAIALRINAGCYDAVVDGNYFSAGAQAAVHAIKLVGASDNVIIKNNRFTGAHSTAMIGGITTLSTNVLIENNLFHQGATEPAIELLTNTTGIIRDNDIVTNLATMVASIVADACYLFRNHYNEDVDPGTGTVIGTASAND